MQSGTLEIRDAKSAERSPLAKRLFAIEGVTGVFYGYEFVSVTKSDGEWQHLKPAILAGDIDIVLIHDGARPLATPELFSSIADAAAKHGGAIPTIALDPREMDTTRDETVARVQTPQGFRAQPLLEAYEKSAQEGFIGTDTAACMEKFFPEIKICAVPGDVFNFKITYPQDLTNAELLVPRQ